MIIFSFLSGILFTIFLIIGFHVLFIDKKSCTHRLFFFICVMLSFIGLDAFFVFSAQTKGELLFWYRMALFPYFFFPPLIMHFCLDLTSYIKKMKFLVFLFYLPVLPFFLYTLFGGSVIYSDFVKQDGVWIFVPAYNSLWFYFYVAYLNIYHLLTAVLIILWGVKSKKKRIERQAVIVAFSLLSMPVAATIENVVLPAVTSYKSPGIGPLYYAFLALGVWFALVRYRFLNIAPELVSKDVACNIDESIILLDEQLHILRINAKTEALIGRKRAALIGKEFSAVFSQHEKLYSEILYMLKGSISDFSCRVGFKKIDGTSVLMDTKFSVVRDSFNDVLGVLVLGREVKELKQLKTFYKFTRREADAIQCIINGFANKEIAGFLGIAERTVKAHLTHIYNKCGVSSKVQLFSLLKDFNIISTYKAAKAVIV
jgi:PAS domain S-box-containing protein